MSLRVTSVSGAVSGLDPWLLLGWLLSHQLVGHRLITTCLVFNSTIELGKELLHCCICLLIFTSALSISTLENQLGSILSCSFLLIHSFGCEKVFLSCRACIHATKPSERHSCITCLFTTLNIESCLIVPLVRFLILPLTIISIVLILTELIVEIWIVCT